MLDRKTSKDPARVDLTFEEADYPRGAVYAAAFALIDRCWVRLDHPEPGQLSISLRPREPAIDLDAVGAELEDELLGQAWRHQLVEQGKALASSVVQKAFGAPEAAAAAAAVDDAAAPGTLDEELGDAGAFEDPLGIAMSWEAKYGKKDEGGQAK